MIKPELQEVIDDWQLPDGERLLERIERMIRPTLMDGYFDSSPTAIVCGLQYHLGGERDTEELAHLASLTSSDRVLDVCCYLGGPAIQLAESFHCRVTGIDIAEPYIVVANRIAKLSGLSDLVDFHAANAANLPFKDSQFTVVWSQCSLNHDEVWLREFDRVLVHGGRLALTFEIRGNNPDEYSRKWKLQDIVRLIQDLGYSIDHAEDVTERDIEIGWKALDRKLSEREEEFAAVLGKDWIQNTHREFGDEVERMRDGKWGNGRILATKIERLDKIYKRSIYA